MEQLQKRKTGWERKVQSDRQWENISAVWTPPEEHFHWICWFHGHFTGCVEQEVKTDSQFPSQLLLLIRADETLLPR